MAKSIDVLRNLPEELHYLIEPAGTFGVYQFDADIFGFLDEASAVQLNMLAQIAERVRINHHYAQVNAFLDRYPITKHEDAAKLYFLFGVMDYADLIFD